MMEGGKSRHADPRAVDSVLRALDFVEEAMGRDIGVRDLADAAFYSLFYFSRLFAKATGHAPYDYLMRRRVAAAAEDVVSTDRSLTEIALDRGFEVPDSFTRAFRRCFGGTPTEARQERTYPRVIARTRIERPYVEAMLESPPRRPETTQGDEITLSGEWVSVLPYPAAPRCPSPRSRILTERDGRLKPIRSFAGVSCGTPAVAFPEFPLSAARVPPGPRARFPVGGDESRLSLVLEFAYRSWLPFVGITAPPAYDIVVADESGIAALELPLRGSSGASAVCDGPSE